MEGMGYRSMPDHSYGINLTQQSRTPQHVENHATNTSQHIAMSSPITASSQCHLSRYLGAIGLQQVKLHLPRPLSFSQSSEVVHIEQELAS